jgi:predicted protein tyrosine phosphatase
MVSILLARRHGKRIVWRRRGAAQALKHRNQVLRACALVVIEDDVAPRLRGWRAAKGRAVSYVIRFLPKHPHRFANVAVCYAGEQLSGDLLDHELSSVERDRVTGALPSNSTRTSSVGWS